MKCCTFFASFLCIVFAGSSHAAAPANDRIVVLISLDGLAGFYIDDPKAEIPTLRKLIAEGARAESMKASTPTVTWPNHTTLVTGVHPARHGVVGNNFLDRKALKPTALIGDPIFNKDEIVKVQTVYDVAKAAGLKTASVRWPATKNAKTLDWSIFDGSSVEDLKKSIAASIQAEAEEAGLVKEMEASEQREKTGRFLPTDDMLMPLFKLIVRKHRPQLALLHLIHVDHIQHQSGPWSPEAYQAIKETDAHVKEVIDLLNEEFPGRASVVIASDHGFSPIKRIVLPNVVLRKAKLLNEPVKEGEEPKPNVRVVVQGGCTMIYILDESKRDETAKKIAEAFKDVDGIGKVVMPNETASYGVASPKDDPHAPDMLLFAAFGNAFGDTAAGDLPFNEKPERKGTHGHDPNLPQLHASFLAWGAGIKPGVKLGEIQNTAVAPTVAKLLGLEMPGTDGRPLEEILVPVKN